MAALIIPDKRSLTEVSIPMILQIESHLKYIPLGYALPQIIGCQLQVWNEVGGRVHRFLRHLIDISSQH